MFSLKRGGLFTAAPVRTFSVSALNHKRPTADTEEATVVPVSRPSDLPDLHGAAALSPTIWLFQVC